MEKNKFVDLSNSHNAVIYIDYENVYKILLKDHTNLMHIGFFEHMQSWCKQNYLRIIKTVAYCNFDNIDLHESYHQTLLQEYGVSTIHTSNRGKNYADLQISIDAMNDMYLNSNIDVFIIISNDKDMSPLLNSIKSNKRKAILITVGESFDHAIRNVPDEHYDLFKIIEESSVEFLYIDYIKEKVYENLSNFFDDIIHNKQSFKKCDYTYTLSNIIEHFSLMEYEALSILGKLYSEQKLFVYKYDYKETSHYGVVSDNVKDALVKAGIIQNEDFVGSFSFDEKIEESYNLFCEKLKIT